jgi:hypothetical protein
MQKPWLRWRLRRMSVSTDSRRSPSGGSEVVPSTLGGSAVMWQLRIGQIGTERGGGQRVRESGPPTCERAFRLCRSGQADCACHSPGRLA